MEINLGAFSKSFTFYIAGAKDSEGTSLFKMDP